jgi:hypothetical protein
MSPRIDLDTLAFSSAAEAAEAIRSGDVTSVQLTEHMLRRIQRFNPEVNSIVSLRARAYGSVVLDDIQLDNGLTMHSSPSWVYIKRVTSRSADNGSIP